MEKKKKLSPSFLVSHSGGEEDASLYISIYKIYSIAVCSRRCKRQTVIRESCSAKAPFEQGPEGLEGFRYQRGKKNK